MISHKVEVKMNRDAHVWSCQFPKFGESVVNFMKKGWADDYCYGGFFVFFDSLEKAEEADIGLLDLVEEYEKLYNQSLVKEMTLADIERIVGHPVKIIK